MDRDVDDLPLAGRSALHSRQHTCADRYLLLAQVTMQDGEEELNTFLLDT